MINVIRVSKAILEQEFIVTLVIDEQDGSEVTYQIVGEDEADLKEGKISVLSPIARAVIGKSIGDVGVVDTPKGQIEYEIEAVDY